VRTTLDGTANAERDDLIEKAIAFAAGRKGSGGPPGHTSGELIRYFYRHVAVEDLAQRSEMDLYGAAVSQYKAASYRPQGTANIRVFTPTVAEHGWSAGGHTVVEVVTDDMPFLVDSVTMELNEQNREVHMVVHPQILVRRDITGELEEILVGDESADRADLPHDVSRESWMHIEIGRESSAEQRKEIEAALAKVLQDVREAVEDWPKMHQQAQDIIEDLDVNPPPLPAEEIAEGQALLRWLADTHFTFLGYREYRLEKIEGSDDPDDVALRAVAGTGFGILRSDQDMSPSFAKLPPLVRAKARE
jgi:glutamate dehydrogenase